MKVKNSVKLPQKQLNELYMDAFRRDEYFCQHCFNYVGYAGSPHHIYPRGRLRLDVLPNILTLCQECHGKLHAGNLGVSINDVIEKYYDRIEKHLK